MSAHSLSSFIGARLDIINIKIELIVPLILDCVFRIA